MKTTIKGNKKESFFIRWLQKMVFKGVGSPGLHGIFIKDGHTFATDGRKAVITPTPKPLKNLPNGTSFQDKIPAGKFDVEMELLEENYPDVRGVIPTDKPESIVGFDPKLLAGILSGMKGPALFGSHGPSRPIEISGTGRDDEEVYVILMPMATVNLNNEQPKIKRPEFKSE